jgi:hypothetical protein
MDIKIFPPVKEHKLKEGMFNRQNIAFEPKSSVPYDANLFKNIPKDYWPKVDNNLCGLKYVIGEVPEFEKKNGEQGFSLFINEKGILLHADDVEGYRYGLDTFRQILNQVNGNNIPCLEIHDSPKLKKRGLMLDTSRGKVYTLEYLMELVDIMSTLRFNVFQLYVEHTYKFKSHSEISMGSDPLTSEDITSLQDYCKQNGIELQANLQSLGHMNRILTRPEYMNLAESEMYWSLDTTSEKSYGLLDDLYKEYLPLFESPWLNVCSDEPYDLGKGKSAVTGKEVGELYLDHLLKLHKLAAKYGKRIMLFGDVVKEHPEFANRMPTDIIYIDWIYDPKETYGTPALFKESGIPYWVSPGTGNWNTLFPRLDGSITNIVNLTLEGINFGAEGMLLTDWNDHGAYTQPGPVYYSYAYASAVAWTGYDVGKNIVNNWIDQVLNLPGYSTIILKLAEIYQIPPIWSKNRSECVMALFDEPIFGKSIRGAIPPQNLKAYDLSLPEGVLYELERHSQHPLRPYFSIPETASSQIRLIIEDAEKDIHRIKFGRIRNQLQFIIDAFNLMLDKLELGKKIIQMFEERKLEIPDFIVLENEVRIMISRFVKLQLDYTLRWFEISRQAEISISLTYYANIISRLYYLQDWLSIQRENFNKEGVDWDFTTYETAGYQTLPTY